MYVINGGIEYHEKNATMNDNHAFNSSRTSQTLRKKMAQRKYHMKRSHVRAFERIQAEVGGLPLLVNVDLLCKELHVDGHRCSGTSMADLCMIGSGGNSGTSATSRGMEYLSLVTMSMYTVYCGVIREDQGRFHLRKSR